MYFFSIPTVLTTNTPVKQLHQLTINKKEKKKNTTIEKQRRLQMYRDKIQFKSCTISPQITYLRLLLYH
jgi:hypothetical protein